ncbi:MAG: PHP domain-containing protein, partial [Candidatus Aenigmatarchaeota archaeon]
CHSWYSKGSKIPWEGLMPPRQVAKVVKRRGFGGFAINDHDSIECWKDARNAAKKYGLIFIPSLEVSTSSGHLIGLGVGGAVKSGMSIEETIEHVHDLGGITVAPHPFDLRSEGIGWDFRKCDAAEIFNSLNLSRIENMLSEKRVKRIGMPAVGGSDAHCPGMIGLTANHIDADDTDGVIREIKKGRVRVSGRYAPIPVVVSWIRERMRWSYDDVLKYVDRNYSPLKAAVSKFFLKRFVNSESVFWNGLGYFTIGTSVVYSALKTVI